MKIKVHCVGLLDYVARPFAVLVADIKVRGQSAMRYVLLSYEQRAALYDMMARLGKTHRYDSLIKYPPGGDQLGPATLRTHAFDVSGATDGEPLHRRAGGGWINCEDLWVRVDVAAAILKDLVEWRAANRPQSGHIWAPNWHVMVAMQACALACELPVPSADLKPADYADAAAELRGS